MKNTSLLDCAAPLLRKLLPEEVQQRRMSLGLLLPVYQSAIAEQLTIEVFERQFAKMLRLPTDDDPARQKLAQDIDSRLRRLNTQYHSSSIFPERHAPIRFEAVYSKYRMRELAAFMPRYELYGERLVTNYEMLMKTANVDFYPFDIHGYVGNAFLMLRNMPTYLEFAATNTTPETAFNAKTNSYLNSFFKLTDTFLNL